MNHLDLLDVSRINKAFSPAHEVENPNMFVGRKDEISTGIDALQNPGGFLAIFGLRGVGKSSIAHQLKLIAEGDKKLPELLGLTRHLPTKGLSFLTRFLRVDKFITNVNELIKRIVFGDETSPSLFDLTNSGDKKLVELKKSFEATASGPIFGATLGGKKAEEQKYSTYVSDDVIQQFRQLLGTIRKDNQGNSGILILIDEFDTIPNKEGFASLVKSCSSEYVKFGVVGIAQNAIDLLIDHSSISRQINPLLVPQMPDNELLEIFHRAEVFVDNAIKFNDDAKNMVVSISGGFPYFCHLIGKEAMSQCYFSKTSNITVEHISDVLGKICLGKMQTIYESMYQSAIKYSPQRELLLKMFSEHPLEEIPTERVYSLAKDFEISNPSQLMQEMTVPSDGFPVLIKVRDRFYRFADPVFKVYAKIRNWRYQT